MIPWVTCHLPKPPSAGQYPQPLDIRECPEIPEFQGLAVYLSPSFPLFGSLTCRKLLMEVRASSFGKVLVAQA